MKKPSMAHGNSPASPLTPHRPDKPHGLGIPQEELESVAGEKEATGALLHQLPPRPGLG